MACAASAQKARRPGKDIAEVPAEAWQHGLARGGGDTAQSEPAIQERFLFLKNDNKSVAFKLKIARMCCLSNSC